MKKILLLTIALISTNVFSQVWENNTWEIYTRNKGGFTAMTKKGNIIKGNKGNDDKGIYFFYKNYTGDEGNILLQFGFTNSMYIYDGSSSDENIVTVEVIVDNGDTITFIDSKVINAAGSVQIIARNGREKEIQQLYDELSDATYLYVKVGDDNDNDVYRFNISDFDTMDLELDNLLDNNNPFN